MYIALLMQFENSLRCGVEKSLRTTNETIFPSNINLSVGSACQNAICFDNNIDVYVYIYIHNIYIYVCV